ncbi:uncharacterized protein LOC118767484 [Octopus sinensis]|uniref:Uncharacterized protein LOC118767484 n=1 Tax=Octopus sinensis TaxID=2607531 RepID=A0A7E6FKS8_9MOLL|nr:uncharacterized protein LOC118767484 [Octopus sinensis]
MSEHGAKIGNRGSKIGGMQRSCMVNPLCLSIIKEHKFCTSECEYNNYVYGLNYSLKLWFVMNTVHVLCFFISAFILVTFSHKQDLAPPEKLLERQSENVTRRAKSKRYAELCAQWHRPCSPIQKTPERTCCRGHACICNLYWTACTCVEAFFYKATSGATTICNVISMSISLLSAFRLFCLAWVLR